MPTYVYTIVDELQKRWENTETERQNLVEMVKDLEAQVATLQTALDGFTNPPEDDGKDEEDGSS